MPPARRSKSPGRGFTPKRSHANWVIAKFDDNWYGGKIAKRHENGLFDIAFDDGDFKVNVAPEDVLRVGSRINANVNGSGFKGPYVDGVVKTIHADGTCAVQFEDGWGLKKVYPESIEEQVGEQDVDTPAPADALPVESATSDEGSLTAFQWVIAAGGAAMMAVVVYGVLDLYQIFDAA